MVLMPGFQSTRLATEGALEPFFFLYTDDSIQGNPETCNQSSMMLNYEVKNTQNPYFIPKYAEEPKSPGIISKRIAVILLSAYVFSHSS